MGEQLIRPVRTMTLLQRRPGMSFEEFDCYWREVHAPLIAAMPEVTRYIQRHIVPGGDAPNPFGVDGFVILEYQDAAAERASRSSKQRVAALADADKFRGKYARLHFEDYVVVDRTERRR